MGKFWNVIKLGIATACTAIEGYFGGFNTGLSFLIVLIVVDLVLGVINAVVNKNVSSTELRKGAVRKCVELVLVLLCFRMDVEFGLLDEPLLGYITLRLFSVVYFGIEEGVSILENAIKLGVPAPKGLVAILKQVPDSISSSFILALKTLVKKFLKIDISDVDGTVSDDTEEKEKETPENSEESVDEKSTSDTKKEDIENSSNRG